MRGFVFFLLPLLSFFMLTPLLIIPSRSIALLTGWAYLTVMALVLKYIRQILPIFIAKVAPKILLALLTRQIAMSLLLLMRVAIAVLCWGILTKAIAGRMRRRFLATALVALQVVINMPMNLLLLVLRLLISFVQTRWIAKI
jgi:hypothetical protein